jgi:hypothetical protein
MVFGRDVTVDQSGGERECTSNAGYYSEHLASIQRAPPEGPGMPLDAKAVTALVFRRNSILF